MLAVEIPERNRQSSPGSVSNSASAALTEFSYRMADPNGGGVGPESFLGVQISGRSDHGQATDSNSCAVEASPCLI